MNNQEKMHLLKWCCWQQDNEAITEMLEDLLVLAKLSIDFDEEIPGVASIQEIINSLPPGGTYCGLKKIDLIRMKLGENNG